MDNPPNWDDVPLPGDDDAPPPKAGKVVDFPGHVPDPPQPKDRPFDRATSRDKNPHVIHINRLDPFGIVTAAWDAVADSNKGAPWVFRRDNEIVTIGKTSKDVPRVEASNAAKVNAILIRTARWLKVGDKTMTPVEPPSFVAADMLSIPSNTLPPLEGIIRAPTFDGYVPRLVVERGYDERSGLYHIPPDGFSMPPVSEKPTMRELQAAKSVIIDTWLGDFPFKTQADRSHAVALAIAPFLRRCYDGPSPLSLIEAAQRGTGKSLLGRIICAPFLAALPDAMTLPTEPEETRKKITSILKADRRVIYFDNVDEMVDSSDLAAVLTSTMWEDRLLSTNTLVTAQNLSTWIATANNAEMSTDIVRRSVRIRLDRGMEKPWEWKGAKIKDLDVWTMENRGKILHAILTMIQSWSAAGAPRSKAHLGSFEGWSRTIGGVLEHAMFPEFLGNLAEMYEDNDTGHIEWRAFVKRWWDENGEDKISSSDLAIMADMNGLVPSTMGASSNDKSRSIRMGKALGKNRDRVYEGLRITIAHSERQTLYCLVPVKGQEHPKRDFRPRSRRPEHHDDRR